MVNASDPTHIDSRNEEGGPLRYGWRPRGAVKEMFTPVKVPRMDALRLPACVIRSG